jgi:hypothetical protein
MMMMRWGRLFSQRRVPLELVKRLRAATQSPYSEITRALEENDCD